MRLIDADKLQPDRMTNRGTVAISQGQIAKAPTVDVLDKIRDEIKAEMDDIASGCVAKYSHDEGYYSGLSWALKIIDKYKAQTE